MNLSTARMMHRLLVDAQEELARVDLSTVPSIELDGRLAPGLEGMANARRMLSIAQDELLAIIVEQEPKP